MEQLPESLSEWFDFAGDVLQQKTEEGSKLNFWIDGQPKVNATFKAEKRPASVVVNNGMIPTVYEHSKVKVKY